MANKFAISATFAGFDKMSRPINKIQQNLKGLDKSSKLTALSVSRSSKKISSSLGGMATKILGVSSALFVTKKVLIDSVKRGIEFDKVMTSAGLKFADGAARGTEKFKLVEQEARKIGASTEFTILQTAEAFEKMAQSGLTSSQSIAIMTKTVDFATASSIELNKAAEIVSKSLGIFGLKTDDPLQLAKNMDRVTDSFLTAANISNATIDDLFAATQAGGSGLDKFGLSVEEFISTIAGISDQFSGAEAGTVVRNFFINTLDAATKKGTESGKAIKKLGVTVKDRATGEFRKFADVLDDIDVGLNKFGKFQQAAITKGLFKRQGLLPAFSLIGARENIRKYEKILLGAVGTTKEQAAIIRKELSVQLAILGSTFEGFIDKMTIELKPALKDSTEGLIKLFSVLTDEGVLSTVKKLFSIDFSFFNNSIVKGTAGVIGLVAALGTLKVILMAINVVAKSNPFILAFTAIVTLTGVILGNLDLIKEKLSSVKEYIPFTGEVSKTQTLDYADRHNLASNLAAFRAQQRDERKREVIELPQNNQKVRQNPQATLDVNFNNMPANTEVKSTSSEMGISVNSSGGF